MNLQPHRLPDDVFGELAAGGGGARALRYLTAAQYSKHVLLLRGVVDTAQAFDHPDATQARHAYDLLATIQEQAPGDVDTVVRHPAVGAWAWRTLRALHDGEGIVGAQPARLAALAAAAAIRSRTPCTLHVPMIAGTVPLPSLGTVALSGHGGAAVVRCAADGSAVYVAGERVVMPADPEQSTPGWRPLPRAVAEVSGMTLRLVIDDLDPFRMLATTDTAAPLTAADLDWWRSAVRDAWTLLVRHHPTAADEIAAAIRVITPLTSPPEGQISASSRETFGTVALSAPPDAQSFALTLCHEVQHAKLAAVIDTIALTRPDDGRRWYAPWRADPRPVGALLQGSYAYLGVSGFWDRQRWHEHGDAAIAAHAEFARWRAAAQLVVTGLLASDRLTAAGEQFVAGMARTLRGWDGERVPRQARILAQQHAQRHLNQWRRRHGDASLFPEPEPRI